MEINTIILGGALVISVVINLCQYYEYVRLREESAIERVGLRGKNELLEMVVSVHTRLKKVNDELIANQQCQIQLLQMRIDAAEATMKACTGKVVARKEII